MAGVKTGRGRGNLGARERLGHTREKGTPHTFLHAQIPPSPSPFNPWPHRLLNYFWVILEVLAILLAILWKPGMSKVQQFKNFIYWLYTLWNSYIDKDQTPDLNVHSFCFVFVFFFCRIVRIVQEMTWPAYWCPMLPLMEKMSHQHFCYHQE